MRPWSQARCEQATAVLIDANVGSLKREPEAYLVCDEPRETSAEHEMAVVDAARFIFSTPNPPYALPRARATAEDAAISFASRVLNFAGFHCTGAGTGAVRHHHALLQGGARPD
jgi:hypothetical protein